MRAAAHKGGRWLRGIASEILRGVWHARLGVGVALGAPHAMVAILKDPEDELPEQPEFMSLSQPVVVVGGLAYTAAHKPVRQDGTLITGRADSEQGRTAARLAALSMLASVKRQLGSLDRVRRVVRLHTMVNCCLLYTSPSPRDRQKSRMPSSA